MCFLRHLSEDDAFATLKGPDGALISLKHGEPVIFGPGDTRCVARDERGQLFLADVADVAEASIVVHDAQAEDPGLAFALSRLTDTAAMQVSPIGIFRNVDRPAYDDLARAQLATHADPAQRLSQLQSMITGTDTWTF